MNKTKFDIQWTLAKRLTVEIEFVNQIMADAATEHEEGIKFYKILECYVHSLLRKQHGLATDAEEVEEMKQTIHSLDELFLSVREEPEMEGWFYGIQGNNLGFALCNLLIHVRNEMLLSIPYQRGKTQ
ncbi:hypothetical protein [Tunturiibacter gelidoferens]|uniref:Uncharacterized protein n=1 Tax=Tunturiibacter gelidiferens TaxID=3069689 RepID=A0A9X0U751_9BACT|nr:hypothetical protein [Edaphobacter lichenicola]MBB5331795.1 hypothetical protein [Edaphobacter lichenicola]